MTTASDFRRVRYIKPSEPCVPIVLHDGTACFALCRPAVEGVALRRPRRDGSSARMHLALTGTGWVLVDATTGERLRDATGKAFPVLLNLDEVRTIKIALAARDRATVIGLLAIYRAEKAAERQAAQQAADEATTVTAASLGLRPWHEASPFEQQVLPGLLQSAAGRCLRDWRTVVLVGSTLVEIEHYRALLRDQPAVLATQDVIAACGWRRAENSEKALATPKE